MPTVYIQNWASPDHNWRLKSEGFTIHPNKAACNEYTLARGKNPDGVLLVTNGNAFEVQCTVAQYNRVVAESLKPSPDGLTGKVWGRHKYFTNRKLSLTDEDF